MELTKYYAVVALCTTVWAFPRPLQARSSVDDPTQDVKHHVCQLIDTESQRLAFLQSALLLFPQGAQMLACCRRLHHLFNLTTSAQLGLSAATQRWERHNQLLNCWQLRACRHRWQEGCQGTGTGWSGLQVESGPSIWPWCWHSDMGHFQRLPNREPVRSRKSPCAKHGTLWAVSLQSALILMDSGRKWLPTN